MCLRIYQDSTLLLLKEQFNVSKQLYFNYLLNLVPKYWRNIYVKLLLKNNKVLHLNNTVLNLTNIFIKVSQYKPKLLNSSIVNISVVNKNIQSNCIYNWNLNRINNIDLFKQLKRIKSKYAKILIKETQKKLLKHKHKH